MNLKDIEKSIKLQNKILRDGVKKGIDEDAFNITEVYKHTGIHNYILRSFMNGKDLNFNQLTKLSKFVDN